MTFSVIARSLIICSFGIMGASFAQEEKPSKRWTVDKIIARVNGVNILQSDLKVARMAKEGGKFTLDEAIVEELLFQRAAEMQTLPTSFEIERQLVSFKMQNNLTELSEQEFEDQLK